MGAKSKLRELMTENNMTIQSFSEYIGVPKGTFEKYLNTDRMPSTEVAVAIHSKMGVSLDWLLGDGGPKFIDRPLQFWSDPTGYDAHEFIPIPRLSVQASAGPGAMVDAEETTGFYAFNTKWMARRGLNAANLAVIAVRGDSMEPRLTSGDLILIDRAQRQIADGIAYVVRLGSDLVVKHIQRASPDAISLISANKLYPAQTVQLTAIGDLAGQIEVIGRVVASMHEW